MMTRVLTILCILVAVVTFAGMTANQNVEIVTSAPQLVNPGDEFMIRVSIEKGSLKNGAVLQQLLPDGFTASAIESEGAKFYFENKMVRLVWDKLPTKSILVVAYLVKADVSIQGFKKLSGTFIYDQNNKTAQKIIPLKNIYVSNDSPILLLILLVALTEPLFSSF